MCSSDALSGPGSNLSLSAFAYQRIISNNSYAHDKWEIIPVREKGSTVSLSTVAVADALISSVKVLAVLT